MATQKTTSKGRWGDLEDEENDDLDMAFLLPPKQVIGPDEYGIRKIIEYKIKDGNLVKITTAVRVRKVTKRVFDRRSWPKFGAPIADDCCTVVSPEEIFFERPQSYDSDAEATKTTRDPFATKSNTIMACRYCGKKGQHWSARCPEKDLAPPPDVTAPAVLSCDEICVRVLNLSPDATEADVVDLFGTIGAVSFSNVIVDLSTGVSKELAFVHFYEREDAQRAIDKLDRYGYDNRILQVDWAQPRTR